MDITNPFRHRPARLARLPRVVRLYILNCVFGFILSGTFTALILWLDVAGIGHLVTTVKGGGLAALVFFMLNGIVFAGVQTAIVVWSMEYDDTPKPQGGKRQPVGTAMPVRVTR